MAPFVTNYTSLFFMLVHVISEIKGMASSKNRFPVENQARVFEITLLRSFYFKCTLAWPPRRILLTFPSPPPPLSLGVGTKVALRCQKARSVASAASAVDAKDTKKPRRLLKYLQ